jgi:hypothetical protein
MNCEYCNTEFKTKSTLNNHKNKAKYCLIIQGKIEQKENIFKCELCDKILSTKQYLKLHKESCTGKKENIFQCEYCNKILSSKRNLDVHIKKCEIIQIEDEFKCEYCEKYLSSKQKLEYHKNICDIKKDKEIKDLKDTLKIKDKESKELKEELKEKEKIIIKVNTQNENYKEQLKKQEEQIKDLQNKLDKIANKAIDKPTTTNTTHNTTNNILNLASHIDFNDVEKIKNIIDDKLTIDNVITGQKGLASFAKEHLLTDENGNPNYLCADSSRNVFKYKTPDGKIKKDIEAKKLSEYLIVGGIKTKTSNIGDKWCRNENGEIDMEKFNILIEPQQSILKLSDDNNIFKRELATLTSV